MRPLPRNGTRRPRRPSIRRSTALKPLGQAETAGRGIMAIDIARVGPGIGMKLTLSSLFGKKLSTRRSLAPRPSPPRKARRLVERFEWHDAPKHGNWLDMAESDLAALSTQRLDRRIPDKPELTAEVAAWVQRRNKQHAKARLAIHNRRRSREARKAISSVRVTWATRGVRRLNRGRSPFPHSPSQRRASPPCSPWDWRFA